MGENDKGLRIPHLPEGKNVPDLKNRASSIFIPFLFPFQNALAATRLLDPQIIIRYYAFTGDLWGALMIRYVIFLFAVARDAIIEIFRVA